MPGILAIKSQGLVSVVNCIIVADKLSNVVVRVEVPEFYQVHTCLCLFVC